MCPSFAYNISAGKEKTSDSSQQVNAALRKVKIEVQWPGGQVK